MGGRLSCACPQAYCYGAGEETSLRIHAELFELSGDGQKWLMVEPRLLYISVATEPDGKVTVKATSQTGKTVLETHISKGQKVEKISDCFVFWRDANGRTLGVNTLSARDTTSFLAHTQAPPATAAMLQHNVMAQVTLLANWNGKEIEKRRPHPETTMVSVNPLNLVFHYNHGLVNVDLLECFAAVSNRPNALHLSYASQLYEFEFSGEAEKFIKQVMNMSSLLLARTTCTDVAVSYLQRQTMKVEEKRALLKYHQNVRECVETRDKLCLKEIGIKQRLSALNDTTMPGIESIPSELGCSVRNQLLEGSQLPSLYLIYANMYNFRMWRKPVDVRVKDLKALVSPTTNDAIMAYPSSSADTVIPIMLPNGKTTVISHVNEDPTELLCKLCDKLAIQKDQFNLVRSEIGWKLILSQEYQVEKKGGKLGLTIYAHNDNGQIKAEVRGVALYAPGGAAIGDIVLSVDGKLISQVASASDVEKLLRDGRIIRLRRKTVQKEERPEKEREKQTTFPVQKARARDPGHVTTPTFIAPPTSLETRVKMEERMVRGINELVQTEKKYVEDLKEMIDRFFTIRTVSEIMESAQRLQKIQITFLVSLEEAIGDVKQDAHSRPQVRDSVMRVSALFVNKCGDFKVYAEYAAGYLRLQRELSLNKELRQQLEAVNSSGEQHCSYESRMIRPVQRVVQYPLLLRAIQSGCEKDSIEARQIDAALHKMQTLAEYVNEMQRIHEQFEPQIDIVRRNNQSMLVEKGVRIDIRDLLIFAHIRWLNGDKTTQEYVIFVFQSLVLLLPAHIRGDCKAKWIRVLPINEIEIEEGKKEDSVLVLVHMAFKGPNGQLSHGNPEAVYHLACCQQLLKQQIIKSIRKARTNFVRETRRPLSGSSQSDGGYGSDPAKERKNS